jgi:hypothetical protein
MCITRRHARLELGHLPVWVWACGGLLLLVGGHAHAARIYKSVDAAGHVTYSSVPPANAIQTETLELSSGQDAGTSEAHQAIFDEIRAVAAQLEDDRKQRELAREAARSKAQGDAVNKPVPTPAQTVIYTRPLYPFGFMRFHRPRSHRHPPRLPRRSIPEQQINTER